MKVYLRPRRVKPGVILASALALCAIPFAIPFHAQADQWDKKTIVTVDQPIQVTNTYLEPGTYVFKLVNSSNDRHIVQIFNRDQNHLFGTIMAIPNYHLRPADRTELTFWETPPGTARAVRAWFYPGDNFGQEFRYPTELRQLALATPPPAASAFVAQAAEPEQPVVQAEPAPATELVPQAPAPQAEVVQPAPAPEPVELAQNTPPPAPELQAAPAPAPAADNDSQPEELPKTASPYPLIGLGGLLSAGLFTLLRIKRLS
jgi:hypothetical protein